MPPYSPYINYGFDTFPKSVKYVNILKLENINSYFKPKTFLFEYFLSSPLLSRFEWKSFVLRFNTSQYGGEDIEKSWRGNPKSKIFSDESWNMFFLNFVNLPVAILNYFSFNSIPYPILFILLAATRVLPIPTKGSKTFIPSFVKNSIND